jgi:hypothetical protein
LDFTAKGGKRQGREVPQPLREKPGAKHPVWKTQLSVSDQNSNEDLTSFSFVYLADCCGSDKAFDL